MPQNLDRERDDFVNRDTSQNIIERKDELDQSIHETHEHLEQ